MFDTTKIANMVMTVNSKPSDKYKSHEITTDNKLFQKKLNVNSINQMNIKLLVEN